MMAGRYIDHLSIIQSIWMTKTAYTWFSNSWMYVYYYIVSSHLTDIIQRGWQLYEFHMLQSLQNIDKNTKMTWPRRDLNTQPSDLESDALPLRHGVTLAHCPWAHSDSDHGQAKYPAHCQIYAFKSIATALKDNPLIQPTTRASSNCPRRESSSENIIKLRGHPIKGLITGQHIMMTSSEADVAWNYADVH